MALPAAANIEELSAWEVSEKQIGLWSDALQRFRRNRLAIAGAGLIAILVLVAFGSPLLVHLGIIADPIKQHVEFIEAGPGQNGYAFGADELGRDTLSRLLFGSRIDNLLMRFTDIWYAFPDLLFVLVVVSVFGPSLLTIFGAIALVNWVGLARLVRGQVLSIKEKEFVEAA